MNEEKKMQKSGVKLPQGRVFQLPTELEDLFDGTEDIGIGPRYIAQVRKGEYHVEFGGPRNEYISYLLTEVVANSEDLVDGRVELIGPEIQEVPPESSLPFGLHYKIYGEQLTDAHIEYLERLMMMSFHAEGIGGTGARSNIWLRIHKKVADRYTLKKMAQLGRAMLKTTCPLVESVEVRIVVGVPEVGGKELVRQLLAEAEEKWEALEAKYRGLEPEDVGVFYGCTICQTFAPNHVCVIVPGQIPYCGIMSYIGARVSYEVEPLGYTFEIPVGEVIDPVLGRYTGVDQKVYERSHQTVRKVNLFSVIKCPTTNCGCFEAIAFYIPEVDGLGLVHRRYIGDTPLGIGFSKMASMVTGGAQNHGFKGVSVRGMMAKGFLMGDGGWNRIVWMPQDLKVEIAEAIPEEVYDKVATDEDAVEDGKLEDFLRERKHPIIEKYWIDGAPVSVQVPPPGAEWPDE